MTKYALNFGQSLRIFMRPNWLKFCGESHGWSDAFFIDCSISDKTSWPLWLRLVANCLFKILTFFCCSHIHPYGNSTSEQSERDCDYECAVLLWIASLISHVSVSRCRHTYSGNTEAWHEFSYSVYSDWLSIKSSCMWKSIVLFWL